MRCLAIFWLFILSSATFAQIIESNDIVSVIDNAKSGSLVVLDIDNTILTMRKNNGFGGDTWFEKEIGKYLELHQTPVEQIPYIIDNFIAADWELMQEHLTKDLELVDPQLVEAIKRAKVRNVTFIAQTARTYKMVEETLKQLAVLGVEMDDVLKQSPHFNQWNLEEVFPITIELDKSQSNIYTHLFHPVYKDGVILTGPHSKRIHNNKGLVLSHFFHEQLGIDLNSYSQIVFIDDKIKNVKAIFESINPLAEGKVVAVRYGATDSIQIDMDLAQKQYLHFMLTKTIVPAETLVNHNFCEINFSKEIPKEMKYLLKGIIP